ncbi:MAG: glycosyltransferase [Patescibacteria group bacterium]|nr:glycosyltransferase [Patescibacteria group bacterium]
MNVDKRKLIVISGGGTGGPSMAPLALAAAYYKLNPEARFVFFGNDEELDQSLFAHNLKQLKADYFSFPSGKLRRYFSWHNFSDVIKIIFAFFRARRILKKLKPDLIISAGSFASVPVIWAGRTLAIKSLVHQQDIRAGLANRLMAPVASKISVCFDSSLDDYGQKAVLIGNPSEAMEVTEDMKVAVRDKFKLRAHQPLLLITGGATGALAINELIFAALPYLNENLQILHLAGQGKYEEAPVKENYQVYAQATHSDFLALIACSDIVVSRAGLGALTLLSHLGKPSIIIPMPNSHQELNANYFQAKQAAVILAQESLDAIKLAEAINSLEDNLEQQKILIKNISAVLPRDAALRGSKIMAAMLAEK